MGHSTDSRPPAADGHGIDGPSPGQQWARAARQPLAVRLARARLIWLRRRELRWDWLALCLLGGLVALLDPQAARADALPERISAGGLYLGTDRQQLSEAPRLATRVRIDINGPVARVTLSQSFRNDSADWVEGLYVFPLPDQAAVDRLELAIGERRIVGEIRERAEARKSYERARSEGRKASLVEQQRPNLFTTSVANVAPGEEISVELGYLQTLEYRDGAYALRFPMTLTPRYTPAAEAEAGPAVEPGEAAAITAPMASSSLTGHRLALEARLDAGFTLARLQSSYHEIDAWWDRDHYAIRLRDADVPLDRDFELVWAPDIGAEPEASIFTEEVDGEMYALLLIAPPTLDAQPLRHDREIVFVVDTSGSMGGPSIVQAREALLHALDRLGPGDDFNVIQFASFTQRLFPRSVPAHAANLQAAREYVRSLDANGGTEMRAALLAGLDDGGGAGLRQLVFITDGSVGNEAALFGLIRERLGRTRLFTVGIGAAPNTHFMRKAAQFGRGSYTTIGDAAQVAQRMGALFERLEYPILGGLDIDWPAGSAAEQFPLRLPDLYAGEPLVVSARLDRLPERLALTGSGPAGHWLRQLELVPRAAAGGISTVWARAKIEALYDEEIAGADAAEIRRETLAVALSHRIVSRFTSFVAIEQQPSRPSGAQLARRAVASSLPSGSLLGLPVTATNAPLHALIGLLMLLGAVASFWRAARFA